MAIRNRILWRPVSVVVGGGLDMNLSCLGVAVHWPGGCRFIAIRSRPVIACSMRRGKSEEGGWPSVGKSTSSLHVVHVFD